VKRNESNSYGTPRHITVAWSATLTAAV
jgi:thiamine pyrophosphokinase